MGEPANTQIAQMGPTSVLMIPTMHFAAPHVGTSAARNAEGNLIPTNCTVPKLLLPRALCRR